MGEKVITVNGEPLELSTDVDVLLMPLPPVKVTAYVSKEAARILQDGAITALEAAAELELKTGRIETYDMLKTIIENLTISFNLVIDGGSK